MKSKENQFAFPGCSAHAFFFCVCAATQGAKQGKNAKTETPVFGVA